MSVGVLPLVGYDVVRLDYSQRWGRVIGSVEGFGRLVWIPLGEGATCKAGWAATQALYEVPVGTWGLQAGGGVRGGRGIGRHTPDARSSSQTTYEAVRADAFVQLRMSKRSDQE